MIRLLFWVLLLYLGFRVTATLKRAGSRRAAPRRERGQTFATHRDPVCGIYVTEDDALVAMHNGQRLYFCSPACRERYANNPDHP